jgi:4-amino-4-deoxy-L-arabinose transferase-like glycosyltransferase
MLGKNIYNAQSGLLSALCYAIYPAAIFFTVGTIWSTSLFVCCFLTVIFLLLRLRNRPSIKGGIGLGMMLGFAALVDPIVCGVYPIALAWLYLSAEGGSGITNKTIAVAVLAFAFTISPWLIRNYMAFGKFVFIKSNFGRELYVGNNVKSDGRFNKTIAKEINGGVPSMLLSDDEKTHVRRVDEADRNAFYLRKAISFIGENPLRFVELTLKRISLFWISIRELSGWQERISMIAYFFVLASAAFGFWLSRQGYPGVYLILFILLLFPLPYYLTYAALYRYRFPIEPILMIFSGYVIHRVISRRYI